MMKLHKSMKLFVISCLVLCAMASAVQARGKGAELTAEGQQLLDSYSAMLETLKQEITAAAPAVDPKKKSSFIELQGQIAKIPRCPNPNGLKLAPVTFRRGYTPYDIAQSNVIIAGDFSFSSSFAPVRKGLPP